MSSSRNRYFVPIEPVFFFEHVAKSPSNTWIGSSRAIETHMVGQNAGPDCTFHLLVGGDFIERADGAIRAISLKTPKPLIEKTYGLTETTEALFETLLKVGSVAEVPAPAAKVDYSTARDVPMRAENSGRPITAKETSATYETLVKHAIQLIEEAKKAGLEVRTHDFGLDRRATVSIRRDGEEAVSLQLIERGEFYLRGNAKFFDAPALKELAGSLDAVKKTHINECGFWATDISVLDEPELVRHITHALGIEMATPGAAFIATRKS
jgi:hypothetical protein